jgi:KRAB domain-containing zinc finger protein
VGQVEKHGKNHSAMIGVKRPYKCHHCNGSLHRELIDTPNHICFIQTKRKKCGEVLACDICGVEFKKTSKLQRHMMTVHSTEKPFKCLQCNFATKTNDALCYHFKRMHDNKSKTKYFACSECDKTFKSNQYLQRHIRKGHGPWKKTTMIEDLPCDVCGKLFQTRVGLAIHHRKAHAHGDNSTTNNVTCEACGQSFHTQNGLTLHVKVGHPSDNEINQIECMCIKCNATFSSPQCLNDHLVECLTINRPRFPCPMCEQSNKCSSTFHTISARVSDSCEECHMGSWHSAIVLKKHVAEEHRLLRFVCDICGKLMTTVYSLQSHKANTHEGLKKWHCNQCGKCYGSRSHLEDHKDRVHNPLTFSCDQCDTVLSSHTSLKVHKKVVHERTTQYQCDFCDYTTFHNSCLKQHVQGIHQKLRPFLCDYCGKAFVHNNRCLHHMVKQHGHKQ